MLIVKQKDSITFGTQREGPPPVGGTPGGKRCSQLVGFLPDCSCLSARLLFNQNDLSTRYCPVAHVLDPPLQPSPHTTLSSCAPRAAASFPPV